MYGPYAFCREDKTIIRKQAEKIESTISDLTFTGNELCGRINSLTSDMEDIIRTCLGESTLQRIAGYTECLHFPDHRPEIPYARFNRHFIRAINQQARHEKLPMIDHATELADKYLSQMDVCIENMTTILCKLHHEESQLCETGIIDIPFPQKQLSTVVLYVMDNNGMFCKTRLSCNRVDVPQETEFTGFYRQDIFTDFPYEYNEAIVDMFRVEARRENANLYVVFNFSNNIFEDVMEAKAAIRVIEEYYSKRDCIEQNIPESILETPPSNEDWPCREQITITGYPVNENKR